jgi:hypothetical protein
VAGRDFRHAKRKTHWHGLIKEGSETMQEDHEDTVMNAALIGTAQRVEHHEIAGYGTVRPSPSGCVRASAYPCSSKRCGKRNRPMTS